MVFITSHSVSGRGIKHNWGQTFRPRLLSLSEDTGLQFLVGRFRTKPDAQFGLLGSAIVTNVATEDVKLVRCFRVFIVNTPKDS